MLTVITPATAEPVSVEDAKAHLRVSHSADDALIGRLITSAREVVEANTGRALAAAGYEWSPEVEGDPVPLWPVAVTSADGVLPVAFDAVPGNVPEALCTAILLSVQADYEDGADDAEKRREAAYRLAFPWRRNLGV